MSYKLNKPYTEKQRIDFIIQYNHNQGLLIEETSEALYALEANEIMVDAIPQVDPDYEAKQQAKEAERIAKLYLTGADVERGIYQAKGMDFDDILAFVMANPPEGLDVKALKIELKANHFYRGNPYVNAVGALLGFTSEQLDKFFEFNDYMYLISEPDVNNSDEPTEENTVVEGITGAEDVNNSETDVNNTDSETPSDEAEGE